MAATARLTDQVADTVAGPRDHRPYVIIYDKDTAGFGLRVTKAGAKSWVLNYRVGGTERRLTIGTHRDPWREAAARKEALRLKALIDQGRDPQGERRSRREAPTVNDLIERWRAEHSPKNRPGTAKQNEFRIRQWIKPALGSRKVADLEHADIDRLHQKITAAGTPVRANRVHALISTMLSLAVRWRWRADNPALGLQRNHEEPRSRYLSAAELGHLVGVLAAYPDRMAADAVRLLLLTGARSGELLTATWGQFDLEAGIWIKPSAHTKSKREHRVPLSAPALQLLAGVERRGVQLFPGLRLRAHWARICREAGLDGVRLHDLRHSYASLLVGEGLSLPVIGQLLGHTVPATTARYAHLSDSPLRAATERVGAIVSAAGARVVPLRKGGRS